MGRVKPFPNPNFWNLCLGVSWAQRSVEGSCFVPLGRSVVQVHVEKRIDYAVETEYRECAVSGIDLPVVEKYRGDCEPDTKARGLHVIVSCVARKLFGYCSPELQASV